MSNPANYTVGWICALREEYIAAQEFLDEEHENPSWVSHNDDNNYALGRMYDHNVVIAVLPDGEYGTASAANVATNMRNTFHNVKIGLMVGIGGGVPSERHDVRLGDVVVSASRDGAGGVFQYDFGKSIQGQGFQHTRFLNQAPPILRAAITGIQTQYERKGHRIEEAICSILDTNKKLHRGKYGRPEPTTDMLFQPNVVHRTTCGAASCAHDTSNLVPRRERTEDEDNPTIHYGLIASSNQLMKDALIRDRLAADKDVLCFEMEAAGLMNTFPCLVIRGICDYSDSHKNKEWQGYAAMVAAAYAKDLLQRIPLNKIEADRIRVTPSDRAYDQRERYQEEQKKRALAEEPQRCHEVPKTSDYEEQKDINPRRVEEASQSALQSSGYPQGLSLSELDLGKDKAKYFSSYHAPAETLDAPAAERNVLQHHRNPAKPIFGVPLDDLYKRDRIAVPPLLSQCFRAVEKFGLEREGIYRFSGSVSDANRIISAFETGAPEADLSNPKNFYHSIDTVAGLVKRFLRELPGYVPPYQCFDQLDAAARIENDGQRHDSLRAIVEALPDAQYAVARDLFLVR
ncbi:unnamed protein product [Penicillium manginii]